MSVYKSDRLESVRQYVETARLLQAHTIVNCVKFPKRYTFILVQKIAEIAEDIEMHIRLADSIMPTNAHEAQIRRDELTTAYGLLASLDDKLQLMYDIVLKRPDYQKDFRWLPNAMKVWGELINKERNLISGVKKADKKRFQEAFCVDTDDTIF